MGTSQTNITLHHGMLVELDPLNEESRIMIDKYGSVWRVVNERSDSRRSGVPTTAELSPIMSPLFSIHVNRKSDDNFIVTEYTYGNYIEKIKNERAARSVIAEGKQQKERI